MGFSIEEIRPKLRMILYIAAFISEILGMLILWFMVPSATYSSPYSIVFFNVFLATALLVVSQIDTNLIREQFRTSLRTFGTLVFLMAIDSATCAMQKFHEAGSAPAELQQRNALRCGGVLVLTPAFLVFIACYVAGPQHDYAHAKSQLLTLDNLIFIPTMVLTLLSQWTLWGMKNMCTNSPPSVISTAGGSFPGSSLLMYVVILVSGTFIQDKEAFDLTVLLTIPEIVSKGPIFDDTHFDDGSHGNGIWKASVSMDFVASILFMIATAVKVFRRAKPQFAVDNIRTPNAIVQIVCSVFGLTGAICAYNRSTEAGGGSLTLASSQNNWVVSFAFIIPFLELAGVLLNSSLFNIFGVLLTLKVAPAYGARLYNFQTIGGYLNAGVVFCLVTIFTSSFSSIYFSKPFDIKPLEQYFDPASNHRTSLLSTIVFLWLAATQINSSSYELAFNILAYGLFIFFAAECEHKDLNRVMYFAMGMLAVGMWPLFNAGNLISFILFFVPMIFFTQWTAKHLSEPLECIHGEAVSYEQVGGVGEKLLPNGSAISPRNSYAPPQTDSSPSKYGGLEVVAAPPAEAAQQEPQSSEPAGDGQGGYKSLDA